MNNGFFLKVSSSSDPAAVAGAIAGQLRECGHVAVQAVSNEAVGRSATAIAYATQYLEADGRVVTTTARLIMVEFDGDRRWGVRFEVTG